MSVFDAVCIAAECPQCWAMRILALSVFEIESEIGRQVYAEPMVAMVGRPSGSEMAVILRSRRREARVVARVFLLDPHECGRPA